MADITLYTKAFCPFCSRAKALLDRKGAAYVEHDITMGGPKRAEMLGRSNGASTVPQIFIAGAHVGGCDDLVALDASGQLDPLLAS